MNSLASKIKDPAIDIEDLAHSITNSAFQVVARHLSKDGIGSLGDVRPLREAIYQLVAGRITAMRAARITGETP